VENIPQQDSAARAFTKLARTFASQMEALKRYRTGGEQKVTVQHVTVNADQAVVADQVVTAKGGSGDDKRKCDQPHALAHASGAPVHSALEADGAAVPRSGLFTAEMTEARRLIRALTRAAEEIEESP
jgi:hypothetical protein